MDLSTTKKRPANEEDHEPEGSRKRQLLEQKDESQLESNAAVVATHYNTLEEKGLAERFKSKIFHMRNFNNWVKSMLINEYVNKIKYDSKEPELNVLDMCCGKGGDLLKWQKARISHLICADIADVSVDQCQERYNHLREKQPRIFSAEFVKCDATKENQREKYRNRDVELHLTSTQFAFHYCFESLPQVEMMLLNATECLKPGGYFIGTMPDAYEIMRRQKANNSNKFGNSIYEIRLNFDHESPPPLFGAKYDFHLEEVVDCPEFLVHFPTLVKLAKKYGLRLVLKETFEDFYNRTINQGRGLIQKMQVFETYSLNARNLSYDDEAEYEHGKQFINSSSRNANMQVGTLSKSEWEVISLYLVFAFQKVRDGD